MLGLFASPPRVDRRLECLSREHPPSVPREGQAHGGGWASVLTGLARATHWHSHKANGEKTGCRDHAADGSWDARSGRKAASALGWGKRPQHRFYRAVEWHLPRATGESDPEVSARSFAPPGVAHRHVLDWLYLQFLHRSSGIKQGKALGKILYSCNGQWLDRSCLED